MTFLVKFESVLGITDVYEVIVYADEVHVYNIADLEHVARAQVLGVGLNLGVILLEQILPGSSAVTPIAGTLVAGAYSRSEELEADRHGVEILQWAGYSKDVMIDTLTWGSLATTVVQRRWILIDFTVPQHHKISKL